MNTTPYPDHGMHDMIVTPDEEHPGHHFRRPRRSFPRAPHLNARQAVSMRDLTSNSSMISVEEEEEETSSSMTSDCPSTPPSVSKSMFTSPPEVPRHGRPINRRLFLQEAQERLSLPNLFAPRPTPNNAHPHRTGRTRIMMQQRQQRCRPSLVHLQPRTVSFGGDSFDEEMEHHGHSMSTRSLFYTNPAEF